MSTYKWVDGVNVASKANWKEIGAHSRCGMVVTVANVL